MNIYIGHSREFDFVKNLYDPIIKSKLSKMHNIVLAHEEGKPFVISKEYLKSCGLMVAEVSYPSTGLGMELVYASEYGVPILCIYQEGCKISSSIKSVASNIAKYQTEKEMVGIIENFIKAIE